MKIQAVILDWAGTTVDFGSCAPVAAVQRAFEAFEVPVSTAEARAPMGLLKLDHIAAVLATPRVNLAWLQRFGAAPGAAEAQRIYETFTPMQIEAVPQHADIIPGVLEAVEGLRSRGIRIGGSTGYTRPMFEPLLAGAARQGFIPDASVTPDEVGIGRPAPFMILENLVRLKVWPLQAVVKAGDTPVDMREGRNAGVWTVGVAATGNEISASRAEFEQLPQTEREARIRVARERLLAAGAHFVVDTLAELGPLLTQIESSGAEPG